MDAVIRTRLAVTIEGKDVTADVGADLLSFSYRDKESDEADTLSFTLKDPDGRWAGSWRPDGGEKVSASITSVGCVGAGTLPCGAFVVDSLRCSGSPRVMEIGAVSVPLDTPIRRKRRTVGREDVTLKDIAGEIAKTAGLSLMWDAEADPEYDRVDQTDETDLTFLLRLAGDAGLSVKVTDDKLVVFDRVAYEKKDPVATVVLGEFPVTGWSFSTQKGETYGKVTVSWKDPKKKGGAVSYTYEDKDDDGTGQEYVIRKRCSGEAEAMRLAKAKLRELNERSVTGSLAMAGDTRMCAGCVIECVGFGAWDGRFIITDADHSVGNGGYVTSVELRRVNSEY